MTPHLSIFYAGFMLAEVLGEEKRQQSPWLSRSEAADYAKVSLSQIDTLCRQGKLRRHKGLGAPLINRNELDRLIEAK